MYPKTAITGVGVVSSLCIGFERLWKAFSEDCKPYSPLREEQYFDPDNHNRFYTKEGLIDLHPRESRIMGKHSIMLMKSSEDAYFAGRLEDFKDEDKGYFAALGMVDYQIEDLLPATLKSIEDGKVNYSLFFKKGYLQLYPLWPLSMLNNIALCQGAIRLSIKGDNCVFSPHSDSSLQAIHEASKSIALGHCKIALAGGASEVISPISLIRYALCNTNKTARHINKPSEEAAYVAPIPMAEGAAIFALEEPEGAKKRGMKIYALIVGFGSSFGLDKSYGGPSEEAIKSSMVQSLQEADMTPTKIDMIFSHYTIDTPEGANERKAIFDVFGRDIKITSSKKFIGDMLSGAGAFDAALAAALMNSMQNINSVLINAFSIEGNASSIILRRHYQ